MKLLGWMHRKFRQNSAEHFKDLVVGHSSCNCLSGQASLDDEQSYLKPNPGVKFFKHNHKGHNLRNSFAGLESVKADDEYDGESPAAMFDLFPGFLAIGTLGSEQVISDPTSTPTFAISFENITEKQDEVTENDLKLINDELEKVLGAEANNDDVSNDSSSRNSHVSTGRSSHVSIITLSGGKPMIEGRVSNVNGNAICPLQGYLFGAAVEQSETTTNTMAKKEHRTSLGELFQKSKLAEENISEKSEKEDKRNEREAEKSAINLMKEKLKKVMPHASSKNSTSISVGHVDFATAETKLNKILHMFRKKVHPESSSAAHKSGRHRKNENKKKIINDGGYYRGDHVHPEEDFLGNREHWIKTDADCKYISLGNDVP
ncbi:hypothetical protein RIF29_14171 [Crotalaria pallida]|uniref:Protein LAZY 1-like n=1 Tax=Crotalaria pallida TaxID=3830 RepID=A0AAN9FCX7_CROPI